MYDQNILFEKRVSIHLQPWRLGPTEGGTDRRAEDLEQQHQGGRTDLWVLTMERKKRCRRSPATEIQSPGTRDFFLSLLSKAIILNRLKSPRLGCMTHQFTSFWR
jgi:hypothetical protein